MINLRNRKERNFWMIVIMFFMLLTTSILSMHYYGHTYKIQRTHYNNRVDTIYYDSTYEPTTENSCIISNGGFMAFDHTPFLNIKSIRILEIK